MDIEHIGSTAIAGIAAKPIIDIVVGVQTLDDVQKFDKHKLKEEGIYPLRVELKESGVRQVFNYGRLNENEFLSRSGI